MDESSAPSHWVHDLDPMLLQIYGEFGIRWYGLAYLAGFLASYLLLRRYYTKGRSPLDFQQLEQAAFALILGLLVGARVGFIVLYDLESTLDNPLRLVQIWKGGMSFHGGLAGCIIACIWITRKTGIGFLRLGDLVTSVAPTGLLFGRIANFINGELYGKVSQAPWAVIFPQSAPPGTPAPLIEPRHPSQLYEAGLEGAVLLAWMQFRMWKTDAWKRPGQLSAEFMLLYAVFRIFCEYFREPDAPLLFGLSRGTAYSLVMIVVGAVVLVRSLRSEPIGEEPAPRR